MTDDAEVWPDELGMAWRFVADPTRGPPRSRAIRVRLLLKYAARELGLRFAGFADVDGSPLALPPEAWIDRDAGPAHQPTVKHKPKEPEVTCPFCPTPIRPDFLACKACWFGVLTQAQRDAFYAANSAREKNEIDDAELRRRRRAIVDEATPVRS